MIIHQPTQIDKLQRQKNNLLKGKKANQKRNQSQAAEITQPTSKKQKTKR